MGDVVFLPIVVSIFVIIFIILLTNICLTIKIEQLNDKYKGIIILKFLYFFKIRREFDDVSMNNQNNKSTNDSFEIIYKAIEDCFNGDKKIDFKEIKASSKKI